MPSTTLEFLQSSRCTALPDELWRVQHGESQADFNGEGNLVAKLSGYAPKDREELLISLTKHFKWGHSRTKNCFLSVLDNYQEAVNWGEARHRWTDNQSTPVSDVELFKIDASLLSDTMVFKVDVLLAKLNMTLKRDTSHEHLVLNRIPAKAIRRSIDINEMVWDSK